MDRNALIINKHRLHEERAELPALIQEASETVARLREQLRKIERQRDNFAARLRSAVICDPRKYNVPGSSEEGRKVTVGAIDDTVARHEKMMQLEDLVSAKQYEVDVAWSFLEGLRAKADSLADLIRLFLAGYFAAPQISLTDGELPSGPTPQRERQVR